MRRSHPRTQAVPAVVLTLAAALLPLAAAPAEARGGRGLRAFRPPAGPTAQMPVPMTRSPVMPAPATASGARLGTTVALALPLTPRSAEASGDAGAGPALRLRAAEATGSLPEASRPAQASVPGPVQGPGQAPVAPARPWCEAGRVVGSGAGFCLVN